MRAPLALLLVLASLGLAACDGKDDDTGEKPAPDDTAPDDTSVDDTGTAPVDQDRDGWTSDVDCDDNDWQTYPKAPELCDGNDNDCDGSVDEDYDLDQDGHYVKGCGAGDDCDDADDTIYTGATEVPYDGIDQDCDGADVDDVDGDGFRASEVGGNDCDDSNPDIHPGAEEIPRNGIDEDCHGGDDIDGDGDGYGDAALGGDDCDDSDPAIHPGATDWMNDGLDSDCDATEPGLETLDAAPVLIDGASGVYELVGLGIDACDIDEDGFDDLVVAAPFGPWSGTSTTPTYHGEVGVFYGAGSGAWTTGMTVDAADVVIEGNGYDFIGFNARCGDVDGDGHQDIVFVRGEINYSPYVTTFGVLIYYGDGTGFSSSMSDSDADAELSLSLGAPSGVPTVYDTEFELGDLDGDGASEIVVEWPYDTLHGDAEILLLRGSRYSGKLDIEDELSGWISPDQPYAGGSSWVQQLRVVGDLDGDGLFDLFGGEPYWSATVDTADTAEPYSLEGRASFVSGALDAAGEPMSDLAHAVLSGDVDELLLGFDAATGDFDGDGVLDGVLSSASDSTEADGGGGLWMWSDIAGFLGTDPTGPTSSQAHVYATYPDAALGYLVEPAGDVDGDGYGDLLVSEPWGGTDAVGRVWVLSGALLSGEAEVQDVALWGVEGLSSDSFLGSAIIGNADFDGDDRPDVVVAATNWDDADSSSVRSGRVAVWLSSGW